MTTNGKMTIERWRKNKGLVAWAKELFASSSWELLVQAMEEAHPRNARPPVAALQHTSSEILLGRIWGYDEYINGLSSLATEDETQELPEPSFAPDKPVKE